MLLKSPVLLVGFFVGALTMPITSRSAERPQPLAPVPPFFPARSAFVHPDTSNPLSWQAEWIGVAAPAKPNQWTAFRRGFRLEQRPSAAIARIAVDSKYWLWVNGTVVVREGGLKRGPTPTDTYFDQVDLTPMLRAGENTIAVLVWHFGKEGFSHKNSGRSGLLFQLAGSDGGAPLLMSDSQWRAQLHPAFGDTGEPRPNFRLPEPNIRFDASQDLADWTKSDYADDSWPRAVSFGRAPSAPWNRLVARPVPLWRETAILDYTEIKTQEGSETSAPRRTLIGRLPYNAQVTPYLEVEAPAGQTIAIETDNFKVANTPSVRAEFVTRNGRQEFECYGWMNGHEVRYSLPADVKVVRVGYRESGYDTDFAGKFRCDDDFLNRLRAKAERTLYVTMRDTYMDCPDRERAQWWGDVVNELGEAFYALDRRADALTRKGMLELIGWQKPDGVLLSPIPAGNWDQDLPLQSLASVGRQGFWTYALYSEDFATLRAVYPGTKRYLEAWDLHDDGLVKPRRGGWPWGDWGKNIDMNLLANVWYHLALQGLRNMAVAVEQPDDLPWIDARLSGIEQAFQKAFWTGKEYRSADYKDETDDRANGLAVVAGLVPAEQFPALLEVFPTQMHASPYMEKYVLEALCLMGEPALAQQRMKQRYEKMVNDAAFTTLWEHWGISGGSVNHAWSGGPLTIMSQYFAGIAPTEPGFARYHVLPQPGTLNDLTAEVPTVRGSIAMTFRRDDASMRLTLDSPQKTHATVGLPILSGREFTAVRLNGRLVWQDGRAVALTPELSGFRAVGVAGAVTKHLCFELPPGQWELQAETRATSN